MWSTIKLFFSTNAVAIAGKLAMLFAALGAIAAVYRAGSKAQENDSMKKELENAKEALTQDGIVAGNSDVDGMRDKLTEALRRKRDS